MESIGTWWMWAGFFAIVLVMLTIDLFVVGGSKQHRVSVREAAIWSLIWAGKASKPLAGCSSFERPFLDTLVVEIMTTF